MGNAIDTKVKRLAFKMYLKPGCKDEYKKRHAALWPQMKDVLKASGVGNYSIYLDEDTNTLFAYQEVTDGQGSQDLGNNLIVQKWWDYMSDLMEVNPDNSPISVPLGNMFHLE